MTILTSISHPLHIATVAAGEGLGRIGLSLCPGKQDRHGLSGRWQRDLSRDISVIAEAGFCAVVTLIEGHEMEALDVGRLGLEVSRHAMDWYHLAIRDGEAPGRDFEQAWAQAGKELRARLHDGFPVFVHCKGGLGRAGTIGSRLLVELGWTPDKAIDAIRRARPGAIETQAQEAHVRGAAATPPPLPSTTPEAIRDRAVGALLGLAVGDAIGTTLEFRPRDTYAPLHDMVGGGPFSLEPGQWTDDTAMALALASSLVDNGGFDARDVMRRFVDWWRHGAYSCTGTCFDIGGTTAAALHRFERTGEPYAGSTDPRAAGNGSLMRLSPVAVRYWNDRAQLRAVAAAQSRLTPAPRAPRSRHIHAA